MSPLESHLDNVYADLRRGSSFPHYSKQLLIGNESTKTAVVVVVGDDLNQGCSREGSIARVS